MARSSQTSFLFMSLDDVAISHARVEVAILSDVLAFGDHQRKRDLLQMLTALPTIHPFPALLSNRRRCGLR